jgi:hypothetical protein
LCSGAILPRGSHHSEASAEKRATSAASTEADLAWGESLFIERE